MTVKELIEILKAFPSEMLVLAEGYEDGYEPIKKVEVLKVEENPDKSWYVGAFLESKKNDATEVVLLNAQIRSRS